MCFKSTYIQPVVVRRFPWANSHTSVSTVQHSECLKSYLVLCGSNELCHLENVPSLLLSGHNIYLKKNHEVTEHALGRRGILVVGTWRWAPSVKCNCRRRNGRWWVKRGGNEDGRAGAEILQWVLGRKSKPSGALASKACLQEEVLNCVSQVPRAPGYCLAWSFYQDGKVSRILSIPEGLVWETCCAW